ncbi:MAG: HdeD family acid-resistance protein [Bacteroidetes bacterium]|nr:MAG: HdeD family acid-resistance protein [Bacteroidota bacterium]
MILLYTRSWKWLLARGVLALLFGVAALVWPALSLAVLVGLFAAFALLSGLVAVWAAVRYRSGTQRWWLLLLQGVLGVVAAVLAVAWPEITALVLLALVAAWAILTGVIEIILAVRLRRDIEGEWLLGLGGLLSVVFGVLLVVLPSAGLLALAWLVGLWAIVYGLTLAALAFKLRKMERWAEETFASL